MGKGIIARTMADLLAQAKDPAEAARIQRAIDSGRNKILYHGTHTDFPAVDPSKVDLGLHLGTSEQATNRLTDLAKAQRGTNRYNDRAQIMPVAVRLGNTLDMRDVGGWGDVGQLGLVLREHPELQARQSEIDELLDSADYLRSQFVAANRHMDDPSAAWVLSDDNKQILSDMRDLLTSDGYDSIKYHNEVENTDGVRGGLLEEYQQEAADIDARMREIKQAAIQRRPPPPDMNDPNLEASMQEFLARSPVLENYMTPEEKDLIQKYGSRHHDLRMNEQYRNDPYSYIVLKPENLRSINAQFDPEFDLSPDLMKAEGGLVEDLPKFGKGQLFRAIQKGAEVVGEAPLKGAPESANIPGLGRTIIGPNPKAEEVAQRYAVESGIPYEPLREYPRLNTELSERIAKEYARMPAAPDDKEVRRAYDALIQETMGQYEQMLSSGVKPYFIDGPDPYAASPYLALKELYDTNRIGVFPTVEGFGSDAAFDPKNNPLLASTPYKISGKPALANDIFRAVHDYMGHAKPGVGFRAAGEEAAYQSHAGMFSPLARRALASETRGQNSWLNYGPFGEKNRSARIEDTIFADQKAGLLPRWAAEEGRTSAVDRRARFQRALRDGNTGLEGALTPEGRLALQHYSDKQLDRIDPSFYGTGLSGSTRSEMNRAGDRNFMDRWYAGLETDVDPYMIEGGLGPYKHTMLIDPELMYPLRYPALDDPDRLWRTGKPTLSEKRIADQNYSGYYYDHPALGNVAVMFDPLDVKKADGGLVEDLPKFGKGQLFRSPKLSELIKDIRNDAGNFRAQRVERAADEIPMLDTRYSIPALDRAFRGDTSEMMTTMNPADFEKYALQLRRVDDDYIRKLGDIASSSGFNDVPYLTMIQPPPEDLPMIFGHEGRHRSRALAGLGDKSSLVRIRTGGNLKESFPRHSAEEFFDAFKQKKGSLLHVVPEEYGGDIRKPYKLPELYADGGLVELAHKYNKGGLIQKYQKGNLVRQWLKGYPEKSLAPLKRADVEKPEVAALNNWIDTSLAKYIKRDYGSPNDPLALLAPEQRHVPLLNEGLMRDSQTNAVWPPRKWTGDIGLAGVSSDTLDWLTNPSGRPKAYIDKVMAENPWLASLPKETILYGDVRVHDLGLQSLRDELHNAMRPDSDLPDMLRLKPESLPRVSVAQASQLVGKINAWRAAESAKAELAASMNPATFIHKEYPEKNMRWVEIKPKDKLTKLPEGYSIGPSNDMSRQSGRYVLHYPLGDEAPLGSYATEEEALEKALKVIGKDDDGGYQSIRDAMKYESDHMHHCLGDPDQGYCDDVFDGLSRVFSLRDKRGAPHVTIETSGPKSIDILADTIDEVAPGTLDDYLEQRTKRGGYRDLHSYVRNVRPDVYEELTRPEIRQIKGHGDRMPVDRYLPFVQDFVRSQKWANIGDLHHTGLRRAAEAFQPYSMTKARAQGIDLPDYLTEQEIADITAKLQATNKPNGMKEGGMAKRPDVRDNPDNESYEESKRRKKTGVSMIDSLLDPMYAIRAGIRAQYRPSDVVWTDEDGNKHSYTAPGLANSTVGLGMFMPGDNPMSDAAMAAYTSGLNYENEMGGLPASEDMGKYTHFGNTLGEVLGQLPIGAAGISKGILSKAAMAIPDYLGPFMRPSVGNYASAALAGEALPHMIGGMMSLAERYGLGSDVPIDADESDRLLASLGIDSAGRKIDNAGIDRYIAESEAREAARDRIAANVYDEFGSLPEYGRGGLFADVLKEYPQLRKIGLYLSDEEKDLFDNSQWRKQAENTINIYKQLPPVREMASVSKAGGAKKGWYKDSYNSIQSIFENPEYPDDPERFTALLAALSPQTSVESNLKNALATWKNWLAAGRPQDTDKILKVMGDSVEGNKGTQSVLDAWRNNSYRALTSPDAKKMLGASGLSGPKVQSFLRNLAGDFDEVTNDAWMAKLSSIDQALFGGQNRASFADELGNVGIKGPGYLAQNAKQRQAAELLGWEPAEVQETGWSFGKTLSDLAGKPNYVIKSMESSGIAVPEMYKGLPVQTAESALRGGYLTDEAIGATPAFGDLMHLPTYRDLLTGAGYGLPERSTAVKQFTSPYDRISTPPSDLARTPEGRDLIMASRRLDKMQRRSDAYGSIDMANKLSELAATERDRRSAAQRLSQGLRMLQRSASELPNVGIDSDYRHLLDNKSMGGLVEKYGALTE